MSAPTRAPSAEAWATAFTDASNTDPEIQAHGKYFTCSYLLDATERTYVIQVESGKVTHVTVDPGPLDVAYQFAIRASAETWRGFGEETPAAMFHGIWAASFQRDMKLEGDLLILMQNLRCITRQVELLRVVGSPV
ncbi:MULTISPECIES: hypothetical protein [Blastococcus]|uniref:SCP2 domain-containing protein n=2 Tax=Blastococcus TaxID=38501 RepID=A0A4Q7YBX3_9ACTN|nr:MULTISPECIES: hypothetical protein [Blastococcus]RZU34580.1 hypothetical protein BKA19_4352 [Blastococcus saxobsidens]TFV90782.1 hypothetical protein E4P40_07035 [Blastococcus sp. CT_GayMR20]TFV90790.1 hypothetical protein E4P40_07090 [Blastococcus sp. CT_GayMR20]SFF38602.1 hypothetical protein SAMN05216574_112155 [Blastococcus sp. DSM 46838]